MILWVAQLVIQSGLRAGCSPLVYKLQPVVIISWQLYYIYKEHMEILTQKYWKYQLELSRNTVSIIACCSPLVYKLQLVVIISRQLQENFGLPLSGRLSAEWAISFPAL